MTPQEQLRQKAPHYLLCFVDKCPLHSSCLHWLAGQESQNTERIMRCLNPKHPGVGTRQCPEYRENLIVRHARGMVHFYEQMPGKTERSIKNRLISIYGRTCYYRMRNETYLITPEMQQEISRVCREEGWTEEPSYDGWQDEYQW